MATPPFFYYALVARKTTSKGIWYDAYRVELVGGCNRCVLVPASTFKAHPHWKGPFRRNTAKELVRTPAWFLAPGGTGVITESFADGVAQIYDIPRDRVIAEELI